jgi:hypothetical protein
MNSVRRFRMFGCLPVAAALNAGLASAQMATGKVTEEETSL